MAISANMLVHLADDLADSKINELRNELYATFDSNYFRCETNDQASPRLLPFYKIDDIRSEFEHVPATGIWLDMNLAMNYFSERHPRGDIRKIVAIADWIDKMLPRSEIWYGHDAEEESLVPFGKARRVELLEHRNSVSEGTQSDK